MPDQLLIDELLKKCRKDYHLGDFVIVRPTDQWMKLNPTTVMGGCSGLYYSLMFQFPKWYYWLHKVDEWMEVSPEYAETYNLTIAQKQKLEVAIKGGLQSAAQAVADYELLKHDYRKYREILDYWKMGKKDDHVLRSLFVDRVDAFTGEGYSLVTMARRWPTIITDFIRMKEAWTDIEKIKDELQVSQAEATVLKTKNELYKEWKTLFFPDVKERFARVKNLMQSRKKSVDEYRDWLKPYIARYKLMKEKTEAKPSNYLGNVYMVPGFGQASATSGVRLFAWQGFVPGEMHKPERVIEGGHPYGIDPYDHVVKEWIPKIEDKYKVHIYENEAERRKEEKTKKPGPYTIVVRELIKEATAKDRPHKNIRQMDPHSIYYRLFDLTFEKAMIKTPKGWEKEDMNILIDHYLISQNIMLLIILELKAKDLAFDRYVNEIIGVKEVEEEIRREVEREFTGEEEKKKDRGFRESMGSAGDRIASGWRGVSKYVIRPGPYESRLKERVTKMYLIPMAAYFFGLVDYAKWKMGVPGAKKKY